MYNTALYTYINACTYGVYAPTQEAALPTVFMAWLLACHSVAAILNYPSSIRRHSEAMGSGDWSTPRYHAFRALPVEVF